MVTSSKQALGVAHLEKRLVDRHHLAELDVLREHHAIDQCAHLRIRDLGRERAGRGACLDRPQIAREREPPHEEDHAGHDSQRASFFAHLWWVKSTP